jgi:AmmeMemoRadiSam system protein A
VSVGCTVGSVEQRRQLLRFARETARRILEKGTADPQPLKPAIDGRFGGAFVTFWSGRELRGCVGTFACTTDLAATIADVTCSSLADPRFEGDPITADELPYLEIEVSILTDPQPTPDPMSLTPGTHGIIVRRGERSGCFLPRVACEKGWSAAQFLSNCCTTKAGLGADAWRDPKTQVLLFTADSLRESDFA